MPSRMSVLFTLSPEGNDRSGQGITLERNNLPRRVCRESWRARWTWGTGRGSLLLQSPHAHWHHGSFDLPLFSWLQCHAQSLPQSPVRAEQPQPYRHGRNSHALRDFLRRILQNIPQQADLPKIWSKLLDGVRQMLAHLAPRKALLGIFLRGGYVTSQRLFARAARLFQRKDLSVAPLPDHVNRSVRRDARHPGVQIVPSLVLAPVELLQPGNGFQKCFLSDVFRFRGIARQPQRAQVQRWAIWKDQFCQRFAVALAGLQEKPRPGGTVKSDGCAAHGADKNGSPRATARRCVIYRKERTNSVR